MRYFLFLLAMAAAAVYFTMQETTEADQDFYKCYNPIYRSAVDEAKGTPGGLNNPLIQEKADRLTAICMESKGYRPTNMASCESNLLPICFRPTRIIDHFKDWLS